MSDEKNLELATLDKQIAHLQAAADGSAQKLWSMTFTQTHDLQTKVLVPLEQKKKERRILAGQIKAAETRAANKLERDKQKAAEKR
jgi:hypothetical protein